MTCTRHANHGSHGLGRLDAAGGRLPFALPDSPRRFARDREVDIEHVVLELDVDFESKSLAGTVTHRLKALRPGVRRVGLDAVEMEIEEALLDGEPVDFRYDGEKLVVDCGKALREGRSSELSVSYGCTPRRGFYFLGPDASSPKRTPHAWSQGQDEDSRHWWPVFDYPNEKFSTEMIATVPADMFALSNGELVSNRKKGGRRRIHWRQAMPHVPYLVTLAVGPFEKVELKRGELPMTAWCLPGHAEEAKRVVRDTAEMVELFARKTGVAYPYEKYDQVFVENFIFGGMENTSATTLTDLVLHDERAAIDYSAEDLISHELAHQWWGNLVTCRDWSQAWLNEGFATYFEVVWKEHARGDDEAWMLRQELKEQYFAEDAGAYRRPIVCRLYDEPIELFDAHLYQKGSWVVSMLRDALGETLFWRALKTYLKEHAGANAETDDLRRAVEQASGRNFERFFEQWIEKAGYPELKASGEWDAEAGEYTLELEQVQEGEETPEAFAIGMEVALLVAGEWTLHEVELAERRRSFVFRAEDRPEAVVVDPRDRVLKSLEFKRSVALLEKALQVAPWAPARHEAATALGANGSPRAVRALVRALEEDAFWGVQAAAAQALGATRSDEALKVLSKALAKHEHPKTRRAIAAALGGFRDAKAQRALAKVVSDWDESFLVTGAAATALGATRQPKALEVLLEALDSRKKSWNEVVRCGVIAGLAQLGPDHRDEIVEALVPWTQPRRFVRCQQAAARALGVLGHGSEKARLRLEELLEDGEFRVKLQAAQSLGSLGDPRSAPALSRMAQSALDGRERRQAREALRRLGRGEEARSQRALDEADALKAENRKLKDRLARIERRLEALETE